MDDEIVLKHTIFGIIAEVYIRIYIPVCHRLEYSAMWCPFRRIAAEEIVIVSFNWLFRNDLRVVICMVERDAVHMGMKNHPATGSSSRIRSRSARGGT